MTRVYQVLLKFYPAEYRELFGEEISTVVQRASEEKRAQGAVAFGAFLLRETGGVFAGCAVEWARKIMRSQPPAVLDAGAAEMPAGTVDESEQRIRFLCKRMEYAIANHDFASARFYSREDLKERENLQRLRAGLTN